MDLVEEAWGPIPEAAVPLPMEAAAEEPEDTEDTGMPSSRRAVCTVGHIPSAGVMEWGPTEEAGVMAGVTVEVTLEAGLLVPALVEVMGPREDMGMPRGPPRVTVATGNSSHSMRGIADR